VTTRHRAENTWAPGVRGLTAGLVMTVTLVAFEALSVATILPVVSRHLGDVRLYGWVFSAFFLASLLGIVIGGAVADQRGVALPLLVGLVIFGAGLAIAGTAANMPILVAGRVVQGIGAGAVPAAAYAAIGRAYTRAVRPRMFAILATAWVVPGLIGPSVSAQVATHVGWRWVFLGLIPLVAVAFVVTRLALPRASAADLDADGRDDAPPTDFAGAAGVTTGAGVLLVGLNAGPPWLAAPLVMAGAVVIAIALRRLTPPGTLRARAGLPAIVLSRGLLTFGFFAADAYVPLMVVSLRHTSTAFAGLILTMSTMTWTVGSWTQARLINRRGPRTLIASGLVLLVVGIGAMASVLSPAVPVWVAVVAWGIAGLGMGTAYSPTSITALAWARQGEEGRVSASVQLCDVLGTALGTGMAGSAVALVHQHAGRLQLGLGLAFGIAGAVAVIGLAVTPRLPSQAGPT
jgi:MFS family permease